MKVSRGGDQAATVHLKVAVYGPSGAGKSTLGATAYVSDPKTVAIICAEKQAKAIINLWNPEALVLDVDSVSDIQQAYSLLKRGFATGTLWLPDANGNWIDTAEPFVTETVVIDSASDIFRTLKGDQLAIERDAAERRARARKGSGDVVVEDDLGQHGWDVLQRRFMDAMRAFRDLPCNLLALWAQDERDENRETTYRPFIQGRDLKSNLPGLFNAVGYLSRVSFPNAEGGPPTIKRLVSFALDERFTTKALDGLDGSEPPSFRAWRAKFLDHCAKVAARRAALRAEATEKQAAHEEAARAAANEAAGPAETNHKAGQPAEQGEKPTQET